MRSLLDGETNYKNNYLNNEKKGLREVLQEGEMSDICVSCKSPSVIQRKPYRKLYKSHTLSHTKNKGCHTQSCTRWLNCHTMPYRKLYSTAGKPYSAIQGAVQDGSKAIQYGSIAIRCHIESHTVQQKSHTVYIQKAIHEKR